MAALFVKLRQMNIVHFEPPDDVIGHNGLPLEDDKCIIAETPHGIGELVSVGSNVQKGQTSVQVTGQFKRMFGCVVVTIIPFCAGASLLFGFDDLEVFLIGMLLAVLTGLGSLWLSRVAPSATFVGTDGIAICSLKGAATTSRSLRFIDAHELFSREVLHTIDNVNSGSSFGYEWLDSSGRELFTINGGDSNSGMEDLYEFGCAANAAWTETKRARLAQEFESTGKIRFSLGKIGSVTLKTGAIQFDTDGTRETWKSVEMLPPEFRGPALHFQKKDASKLTRRGHASFATSYVADTQCFFIFLSSVAQLRLSDEF